MPTELAAGDRVRSLRGSRAAVAPMLNSTRHRLQTFYAPHNRRLAALLGDQRFLWGGRGER